MDIKTILEDRSVQIGVGVITGFGLGYATARHIYRNQTIVIPPEETYEEIDDEIVTDEEYNEMAKQYTKVSSFEELALSEDGIVVVAGDVAPEESTFDDGLDSSSESDSDEDSGETEDVEPEPEPDAPTDDEEDTAFNIFANSDDWDYEAELASRTKTAPYVIHKDEFFSGESGYNQLTFTYYSGDDILVDEQKIPEPIYRHDRVVGELKFGHGSGDRNVVYIRNDDLATEYEVIKSEGKYSVEVMGLEDPDDIRRREAVIKFRDSD
jgi:hypothetical protein